MYSKLFFFLLFNLCYCKFNEQQAYHYLEKFYTYGKYKNNFAIEMNIKGNVNNIFGKTYSFLDNCEHARPTCTRASHYEIILPSIY